MIAMEHLGLFLVAGVVLNLTPGPDVLYIVSQALRGGVRPGLVAALGITAGCFVHVAAAALGVGALLTASAMAFNALKWVGAAYLVWVGCRLLWRQASSDSNAVLSASVSPGVSALKTVFFNGFMTNVLNPKVALFFLAFLPQFIAPGTSDPTTAFLALGLLFNLASVPINLGWAALAAWLAGRPSMMRRRRGRRTGH